jgi:hypothetical protein
MKNKCCNTTHREPVLTIVPVIRVHVAIATTVQVEVHVATVRTVSGG